MAKLALALLSLPHSGASVERTFSQLKLIKNERRTSLNNDTLQSLLITKVNNIEIDDKKIKSQIFSFVENKNFSVKRKRSFISRSCSAESQSEDLIATNNENMQTMENEGIQTKKLKLDNVKESNTVHSEESVQINLNSQFQGKLL